MTHHTTLPASDAFQLGFENLHCLQDVVLFQSRCCVKCICSFFLTKGWLFDFVVYMWQRQTLKWNKANCVSVLCAVSRLSCGTGLNPARNVFIYCLTAIVLMSLKMIEKSRDVRK